MALKNALAMAAGIGLLVSSPEARTEKSLGQDLQYDSESSVDGSTNRGETRGDYMIARPDSTPQTRRGGAFLEDCSDCYVRA